MTGDRLVVPDAAQPTIGGERGVTCEVEGIAFGAKAMFVGVVCDDGFAFASGPFSGRPSTEVNGAAAG